VKSRATPILRSRRSPRHRRGAFTLVEVVISVVIVGGLLAASLRAVALANVTQYQTVERTGANNLARGLLAEITQQAYVDPGPSPVFGPESGQSRPTYDDVDDYNGYSESPLVTKSGTKLPIPQKGSWMRSVTVTWVDPQTLAPASPQAETGVKLISVTVLHRNKPIVTVSALRTSAP
jgi:prepilin-type N-terminal cleavage/methylation domain-containing protein